MEVDEDWNGLTLVAMWSYFDLGPKLVVVQVCGGYGGKGSGLIMVGIPRFRPWVGDGDGDGCLVFVEYGVDTGYGGELLRVNGLQWCRGGEWLGDMCC
ncbi:hypothetical protein D5086_021267 [Populus alba]|uniref:Uncharacterized protein n=1 Tax=Populus alba TaxID=43335 RepID=A0ACC4BBL1_POPAL